MRYCIYSTLLSVLLLGTAAGCDGNSKSRALDGGAADEEDAGARRDAGGGTSEREDAGGGSDAQPELEDDAGSASQLDRPGTLARPPKSGLPPELRPPR